MKHREVEFGQGQVPVLLREIAKGLAAGWGFVEIFHPLLPPYPCSHHFLVSLGLIYLSYAVTKYVNYVRPSSYIQRNCTIAFISETQSINGINSIQLLLKEEGVERAWIDGTLDECVWQIPRFMLTPCHQKGMVAGVGDEIEEQKISTKISASNTMEISQWL